MLRAQEVLGLPIDHVRLSRRGEGDGVPRRARGLAATPSVRSPRRRTRSGWRSAGSTSSTAEGEAAFYGPKLDIQVSATRGHEETIATVQVDFNQPERFDLTYDAADGERKRVVMIHRGTVGSMERVVAALLERYAGRLPLWLAPVQLCVLPV